MREEIQTTQDQDASSTAQREITETALNGQLSKLTHKYVLLLLLAIVLPVPLLLILLLLLLVLLLLYLLLLLLTLSCRVAAGTSSSARISTRAAGTLWT